MWIMTITNFQEIKKACLVIIFLAISFGIVWGQHTSSKIPNLSLEGYQAYEILSTASGFYLGGIGFAGSTTSEECNFRILLKEPNAVEAFQSLVSNANYEGGIYGLFGLRLKNNKTFKKFLLSYKAKGTPPEREWIFPTQIVPKDTIMINGGGDYITENVSLVLIKIESGKYNNLFKTYETC